MALRRRKPQRDARPAPRPRAAAESLTGLLYDDLTDLPTVPLLMGRIRRLLRRSPRLGLLSISIMRNERSGQGPGWEGYEALVRHVAAGLRDIKRRSLRREDYLSEVMISGNAFVILLQAPRGEQEIAYADLDTVRQRVLGKLEGALRERLPPPAHGAFGLSIGCAILTHEASVRVERLVYSALESAFADAVRQRRRGHREAGRRLSAVIGGRAITTVYQPVVDLLERRVLGYEALTRVSDEAFPGTETLFQTAYEHDALWRLEQVCRETAIRGARGLPGDQLLFLNIEPDSFNDPALRSEATFNLLRDNRLHAGQVVLEMTEHVAVRDFAHFRQILNYFQFHGFRLAVDDVGSGYSGLKSIAEIRPDFIKIDMALIRDVHLQAIKQDLVATIVRFCSSSGITLIAEGVETLEELRVLRDLGVRYAQGFLFARPGPPFPHARLDVLQK
jgi:EAL domain-containing protein (putative c-di-GMP-specific phosphodiesterase class I)